MIVPAAPPALTCKLPGPWHDSQPKSVDCFTVVPFASLPFPPLLFTISVFVLCSRAWVAVRKSRTISSWQVLHSSEPTNSAPGMLGGAKIVRVVVLQESKMTASAAVPPVPHKIFSRLPRTHRASLECHTKGECCQKPQMPTTHFYGKKPSNFSYRHLLLTLTFATYALFRVPTAAGVLCPFGIVLSPMIAGAAMTFSSESVIANALRLRRQTL